MVTTGRDEREAATLKENFTKHFDIYISTSRMAHRAFSEAEQKSIAMKDIVTSQIIMDIPRVWKKLDAVQNILKLIFHFMSGTRIWSKISHVCRARFRQKRSNYF